ncbi:MAG: glycoside hydrolase family 97 protein [Candidatus Marinimicrobia bacterium]|nr:glycoside hydrolase family 97 protein [Candidatus Neomarinimicrobiota bacterium]
MNKTLILITIILFSCKPEISTNIVVLSPDDKIQVEVKLDQGMPFYAVQVDGKKCILPSALGYRFRGQPDLTGPFQLTNSNTEVIEEHWGPVWGQEKSIHSLSRAIRLELREVLAPHRQLNLHFRVFNDGVAFRYEIPAQPGIDSIFITEELSEFNFAMDGRSWWIPGDYDSYEFLYTQTPLSDVKSVNTPITMIMDNGLHISLHEANLTGYPGMTLGKSQQSEFSLRSILVPWPDGDKVKQVRQLTSPWRTITIGQKATDLLNSRMILNLNPPNLIDNPDWIQPMKYMGIWWGMHLNKETWVQGPKHGATTANAMHYIDFAAENQIQGLLIEGWNVGWEKWGQPDAFVMTQAYDDYDIEKITAYGRERGVSIIGHHETGADADFYERQLEAAFAYAHDLGIQAVKSGYVGAIRPVGQHHHGQWMVEHYRRVVEMAAKYQVSIDVHEPIKPTGIERTWPNMLTREGGRGQEYNAWSEGNPPIHTTILPFTRLLAGPMDYTPGIFDLRFDRYKPDNRVQSTLAKQLALMVVLYSPLQMAADLPENYVNQPAFQFIRDLEVVWDESLYLEAEIGKFVTIARRHGSDWFLGAITNGDARELEIPINQMLQGEMIAECYVDTEESHWDTNPYPIWMGSYTISPADTLKAKLAPGGGMAIRFRPITKEEMDQDLMPISELRLDQRSTE